MIPNLFRRGASVLALLALGLSQARAQSFDIVGLRLGMSEAEALQAIQAYRPDLKISRVQSAFGYSDGVQSFQTQPFLSRLLVAGHPRPTLAVYFTPPPKGGRVWAIERDEPITGDPPNFAQYTAALKDKYGTPTAGRDGVLAWDFPAGRPNCIPRPPDRPGFPAFKPSGTDDLGFLLRLWQQKKVAPADLSQCASRLHYVLSTSNGEVISRYYALLVDVPAYAAAYEAANREVEAQEAAARKRREGKAQTPRL